MSTTKTPGEVLTLHDAAKFLQVSEKTLWQETKAGKVPHFKVGKQYRFIRAALLEWACSSDRNHGGAE